MKDSKINFSIVTVCYNSVDTIEKTIRSVIAQSYKDFEYIVVDGGSNDGTIDIVNKYKSYVDIIVSEPDNGIYDAFNKGVKLASGDFIAILNSDDTYNINTLELVSQIAKNNRDSLIYGDTYFIDENDVVFGSNIGEFNPKSLKTGIGFMHPTAFISKEIYNQIGLYSLSKDLYIASDADFLLRCHKAGFSFVKGNYKVFMRTGGLSETKFYLAHKQYLNSLLQNNVIDKNAYKIEKIKLFFKGLLKRFLTRKKVAYIKLQIWIIIIAIFNFVYRYTPFNFLKRIYLKASNFKLGERSYIHRPTFLSLGKMTIGNYSVINPNCLIDNRGQITIGSNVSIAHYCKIYTTGHDTNCSYFTGVKKPVVIKDFAVLFSSCIVQPGVTIGKGAVVFPGSVVIKDVPDFTTVGGNPAAVIGKRNKNLKYNLDYGFKFIK